MKDEYGKYPQSSGPGTDVHRKKPKFQVCQSNMECGGDSVFEPIEARQNLGLFDIGSAIMKYYPAEVLALGGFSRVMSRFGGVSLWSLVQQVGPHMLSR